MTDSTNPDGSNDKTVENAEQMGGGYGGPFPVSPEEEGTEGSAQSGASGPSDSGDSDAATDSDSAEASTTAE